MANTLVRNSIYKFLDEGLSDTFVTYNSNFADIKSFSGIYPQTTLTAGDTTFIAWDSITSPNNTLYTDFDLTGWTVGVMGETSTITSYNKVTGEVVIDAPFTVDIEGYDIGGTDEMTIDLESWIYFKSPYVMRNRGQLRVASREMEKLVLYIKTKNDNEKNKINNILQSINELVYGNYSKFAVYDTDGVTILGYADIKNMSAREIYDNTSDLQSFMIEWDVSYRVKYI